MLYFTYSDHDLLALSCQGNELAEEELVKRYGKVVRACARPYFLAGGDSEDLIQEGMMGLLSAIRKFDPTNGAGFKTFAEQCIRNRILSAVESASRQKHKPLNTGVSLEELDQLNQSPDLGVFEDPFLRETENTVLEKENEKEIIFQNNVRLSQLERKVLDLYLSGMSYQEIADTIHKPIKSIDNAVQRIRKKCAVK